MDIVVCIGILIVFMVMFGIILFDFYDGVIEYFNNLNCQWKINVFVGKVIILWFNVCIFIMCIVYLLFIFLVDYIYKDGF